MKDNVHYVLIYLFFYSRSRPTDVTQKMTVYFFQYTPGGCLYFDFMAANSDHQLAVLVRHKKNSKTQFELDFAHSIFFSE